DDGRGRRPVEDQRAGSGQVVDGGHPPLPRSRTFQPCPGTEERVSFNVRSSLRLIVPAHSCAFFELARGAATGRWRWGVRSTLSSSSSTTGTARLNLGASTAPSGSPV